MKKFLTIAIVFFSFINSQAQLTAPVQTQPANNAIGVPVNVRLTWYPSTGGTVSTYIAELSLDTLFTSPVSLPIYGTGAVTSELIFNQVYYWRVRGVATNSTLSPWSGVRSFTTFNNQFTDLSPVGVAVNPIAQVKWDTISGVTDYSYEISTDSLFGINKMSGTTQHPLSLITTTDLKFNTVYYYRVKASHSNGISGWSANKNFTTISSVNLISPAASATAITPNISLKCTNTPGVKDYRFELDVTPNFDSNSTGFFAQTVLDIDFKDDQDIVILAQHLNFGQTYHWRVKVTNTVGVSGWTPPRSFTIVDKVALLSPADSLTGVPTNATFTWGLVTGATKYQVYIDQNAGFTNPIVLTSLIDSTSHIFSDFSAPYFWKVRAIHSNDTSGWSDVWMFEVHPTGINTRELEQLVRVFPNPVSDVLQIELPLITVSAIEVSIYDVTGKLELAQSSKQIKNGLVALDVHQLKSGIYILNLKVDGGSMNYKIIKN